MLRQALQSVIRQETNSYFSFEIIVVDDASTDDTRTIVLEIAHACYIPIKYVGLEKRRGVAHARNKGIRMARGKWIAFFDDDQLAEENWLKNLLAVALQANADLVGGTILLDLPRNKMSQLGPIARSLLGEHIYKETPEKCVGKSIPSSGNLLILRRIFDLIDRFDTSLLAGGEDSDFIVRARRAHFKIWTAPAAKVYHLIPLHRTEAAYLRTVSFRWACQSASMNYKLRGIPIMLLSCIARIGQAVLINFPYFLIELLKRNYAASFDRKCLLWRTSGYVRQSLFLIAPKLFPQRRFFENVRFGNTQCYPKRHEISNKV